jgi:thioredoxin 1
LTFSAYHTGCGIINHFAVLYRGSNQNGENMSVIIKNADSFTAALKSPENKGKQVIVDFWATWCGPCRAVSPALDRIEAEEDGNVVLLKVDVDENPELSAAFGIQSIPTLMFFKDGVANVSPIIGVAPQKAIVEHFQAS